MPAWLVWSLSGFRQNLDADKHDDHVDLHIILDIVLHIILDIVLIDHYDNLAEPSRLFDRPGVSVHRARAEFAYTSLSHRGGVQGGLRANLSGFQFCSFNRESLPPVTGTFSTPR